MYDVQKINKARRIYIAISASAALLMVAFIVLTEVFLSSNNYVTMFIMLAFAAIFCYTCVFSAFSAYERAFAIVFISVLYEVGMNNVDEVAVRMSWKPKSVEKFMAKCRKWKYID